MKTNNIKGGKSILFPQICKKIRKYYEQLQANKFVNDEIYEFVRNIVYKNDSR